MAAKVTAKTPAARRPARKPAPAADTYEPVHLPEETEVPEERVPLFYIGDREYSVVKRPGVNIALQYLHLTRTKGETIAQDFLLEELLGVEGYEALRNYNALKPEQFERIVEVANELTMGSLEAPKA
jgi:hypothetical protein